MKPLAPIVAIAATSAMAACGSAPATTTTTRPATVRTVGDRVSLGTLSVAVPRGWRVVRAEEPPCFPRQKTLYVWTATHTTLVIPCPAPPKGITEVATLTCYIGPVAHLFEPSPTPLPVGVITHMGMTESVVQGKADETVFDASARPQVLRTLLASVRLTGSDCSS